MRLSTLLALGFLAMFATAAIADDNGLAALKLAAMNQRNAGGCDCGDICLCGPKCDCLYCQHRVTIMASAPPEQLGRIASEVARSSYGSLRAMNLANGTSVVIGMNCTPPSSKSYVTVTADERDGLQPGKYIVIGEWQNGAVYTASANGRLGYVSATATEQEIRNILNIDRPAPVQYIQQPQIQYMPMSNFGGGMRGGVFCAPGQRG